MIQRDTFSTEAAMVSTAPAQDLILLGPRGTGLRDYTQRLRYPGRPGLAGHFHGHDGSYGLHRRQGQGRVMDRFRYHPMTRTGYVFGVVMLAAAVKVFPL